jgi:hypothetical protein
MHFIGVRCRSYGEEFTEYSGDLEYIKGIFMRILTQGRLAGAGKGDLVTDIPFVEEIDNPNILLKALNDAAFNLKLGIDYEIYDQFIKENPYVKDEL